MERFLPLRVRFDSVTVSKRVRSNSSVATLQSQRSV